MGRLFGTDGVRGIANADLTPELTYLLGRAGAYYLARTSGRRPQLVVGRDTRASGELLEAAVVAGICSAGADCLRVGVMTTPGVAFLVKATASDAGVVVSASHNPMEYNGIKFFGGDGHKLSDAAEDEIEAMVRGGCPGAPSPTGTGVGRVLEGRGSHGRYLEHLLSTVRTDLSGMRVVVDCAHGAASDIAPQVLEAAGAQVLAINREPDGTNINLRCGSTHPEALREAVREWRADAGLAHDGDADRVVAVDEQGRLLDGDHIMLLCALWLQRRGLLRHNAVVTTVMSNLGLDLALSEAGIKVYRAGVGDRQVLAEMLKRDLVFGGEQSGHIIFLQHSTTGDGILTALQFLMAVKESGEPLSKQADRMPRLPQVMVNVPVTRKDGLASSERITLAIRAAEEKLGSVGRVLVRPSGTEPVVRVMAEGQDGDRVRAVVEELAAVVKEELAGKGAAGG